MPLHVNPANIWARVLKTYLLWFLFLMLYPPYGRELNTFISVRLSSSCHTHWTRGWGWPGPGRRAAPGWAGTSDLSEPPVAPGWRPQRPCLQISLGWWVKGRWMNMLESSGMSPPLTNNSRAIQVPFSHLHLHLSKEDKLIKLQHN